jgi:catechol 2,3-dioxygenase-like lactoylglutathione lyase family enzyme
MKIEHFSFQVQDPDAMARWYVAHLGFRVACHTPVPSHGYFLADEESGILLEIYCNAQVPVPNYAAQDSTLFHFAFAVNDVTATRARLSEAGAIAVGEPTWTERGDEIATIRDPWGIPIQLVKRIKPMI